jgi:hypothetical protein
MAATYEPIASYTVPATTVDTVTFSSIPGTYTDLIVVSDYSLGGESLYIRFNSDSGSNYSSTRLIGNGSSASSSRGSNQTAIVSWGASGNQSSGRTTSIGQVFSYANTNVFKTTLSAFSNAAQEVNRQVGLWRSTSAVTSLTLTSTNATWKFSTGDTFSLYGIKASA